MPTPDDRPWLTAYPEGVGPSLELRHPTTWAAWRHRVAEAPDAPAIIAGGRVLSVAEVDELAAALAAVLAVGGPAGAAVGAGDRVGLYIQNDPQWPVALLACWQLGAIAVALNPMLKAEELRHHLTDSGTSVLICLEDLHREVAAGVVADTPVRRVITTRPGDLVDDVVGDGRTGSEGPERLVDLLAGAAGRRPAEPVDPSPDEVAVLTYTSGTTGPPKGAMNTHGGIAHNAQLYADWFRLDADDVVLGLAPLFHITGIVAHTATALVTGAPLVLFHRFDAGEALRLIEAHRASFLVASITAYIAMLDHPDLDGTDLSSLRAVASGGAPVSTAVADRWLRRTGVPVRNIYGLTETTSPSHMTPPDTADPPVDQATGALSIGVPVPGARCWVVDPATREPLPPGEAGELVIAGPMVVPGYWDKPEESAAAIPDGRLHTGDVAVMDEGGWCYLVDRLKDQINAGGYKVWPREVEDVLYQHPAVREAAVVGVPDAYRGETVKAVVSLVAGAEATEEELIGFCRDHLAAYKYPRVVEVVDELPKTATGKVLRRALR